MRDLVCLFHRGKVTSLKYSVNAQIAYFVKLEKFLTWASKKYGISLIPQISNLHVSLWLTPDFHLISLPQFLPVSFSQIFQCYLHLVRCYSRGQNYTGGLALLRNDVIFVNEMNKGMKYLELKRATMPSTGI